MNQFVYPINKVEGKIKPKIPIRLTNPKTGDSLRVLALIDTGSDACTIPSMISRTLGLQLNDGSKRKNGTKGISDKELDTFVHVLEIELLDNSKKKVIRKLDVVVNTIDRRIPVIVGTMQFLEKLNISLNYPEDKITLSW